MTRHVISARFARRGHWQHGEPLEQYVWDIRYIEAPVVRFYDGNADGDCEDASDNTLCCTNDAQFNTTGRDDWYQALRLYWLILR